MPIIWRENNDIYDNVKFNSIIILLENRSRSSIVIGKNIQKYQKKITKPFCWSTQVSNFNTNYNSNVLIVLKNYMWRNFWRGIYTWMNHSESIGTTLY